MPLDRDIAAGYKKSWQSQRNKYKPGDWRHDLRKRNETENLARVLGKDREGRGFFKDRRNEKAGIMSNLFNWLSGEGKRKKMAEQMLSAERSGSYYPPRTVDTVGLYAGDNYNFPEAKQVNPVQTTSPWAGKDPRWINERMVQDEITEYGGSPSRSAFYEDIAQHYEPGGYYGDRVGGYSGGSDPKYGPLAFEQSMANDSSLFPELEDYSKDYDIFYPNPGGVYSSGNYYNMPFQQEFGYKMPRVGEKFMDEKEIPMFFTGQNLYSRGGIASLKR